MDRMERCHYRHPTTSAATRSRRIVVRDIGAGGLAAALVVAAGIRPGTVAALDATPAAIPPLLERWLAVWNRDPDGADALYAGDAVLEDVAAGAVFRGRDAVKAHVEEVFAGFPEHVYEPLSAFVAGDRGAAEFRWTAAYTGTYPGLPAGEGQSVTLPLAAIFELDGDVIRREAHYYDVYTFLVQLGILPAPGTPAP